MHDQTNIRAALRKIVDNRHPLRLEGLDDPTELLLQSMVGRANQDESDPRRAETATHIQRWIEVRKWKRQGSEGNKPHEPNDTPSEGLNQAAIQESQRYNDTIERVMEQAQRELEAWKKREADANDDPID